MFHAYEMFNTIKVKKNKKTVRKPEHVWNDTNVSKL